MVRLSLLAFAATTKLAQAWLPNDVSKKLLDTLGFSLFDDQNTTYDELEGLGKRWLSTSSKIRGVNLGSLFVFEPWIDETEWNNMGCGGQASEFDCVMNTGQERSNAAFQKHWDTWMARDDLEEMVAYGINTIRIPLGYWLDESLVDKNSEHFPRYLIRLCGWASDLGLYIILDQHGAPGAQVAGNSFTGQNSPTPGFYNDYQYDRGVKFVEFLRKLSHDHTELRNVGTIQLVNEPTTRGSSEHSLRSKFYKNAYNAIRKVDRDLGWDKSVPWTHDNYIPTSCNDKRNGDTAGPTIVGEWSISPPDDIQYSDEWNPDTQKEFYENWFTAQVHAYEKNTDGWVFWTWKAQLGDYRWSYRDAVNAGVIPTDLNSIANSNVCG